MRLPFVHLLCLAAACLVVGCRKAPPEKKSSGKAKYEKSARRSQDRENTERFVTSAREVMKWHQAQPLPQGQEAHAAALREFSKHLETVPSEALPAEVLEEWNHLKHASQQLAETLGASTSPAPATVQTLRDEGKKASEALNQWLNKEGFSDLHF